MKNILVAIDGSEQSMRAVSTGSKIAAKFSAKLLLLILPDPELPEHLRKLADAEHFSGGHGNVLNKAAQFALSSAEKLAQKLQIEIRYFSHSLLILPARQR